MSYSKKVATSAEKYDKGPQQTIRERQLKAIPTNELREMIESEVYDILGGIKTEIEGKMKEVDRNIAIIKGQITELKRAVAVKNNPSEHLPIELEGSLKELFTRIDKMQKQVSAIKNVHTLSDLSYINVGDVSKSNISTYKLNQSAEKSNSKQKISSPLFNKTAHQTIDIGTLIFQNDKPAKTKAFQDSRLSDEGLSSRSQEKKTQIFSNPLNPNLRKPPLPSTDLKPKFSTSHEMITSSSFYDQPLRSPNYELSRTNQMMTQANPVQKELSKNKSVFMRKKKSEQKVESPPKEPERSFTSHRFENQLEDFSPTNEDESFNIELEYSKDTFLEDL